MKTSSIFTAATVLAAMMVAAPASAAPVAIYTMNGTLVTQKLTVSGCASVKSAGVATITFNRDDAPPYAQTFTIDRTTGNTGNDVLPDLAGTWDVIAGSSSYTVYMNPYNTSVGPNPLDPPLAGPGIDVVLDALEDLGKASCSSNPKIAGNTLDFNQPSFLVTKAVMTVKNKDNSGTLSLILKGKQTNSFKGTQKSGKVSSTTTIKGTVTKALTCPPAPAACSVATVTM
jgi:hypothetical protein